MDSEGRGSGVPMDTKPLWGIDERIPGYDGKSLSGIRGERENREASGGAKLANTILGER